MPVCGHCSSAATSAPCARSSARPTSWTRRVRLAISLADSIRQTASIVRWISGTVMVMIYLATELTALCEYASLRPLRKTLFSVFSVAKAYAQSLSTKDFINLTRAIAGNLPKAPREFNRFFLRFGFAQRKADNRLFCLSERTIGDGDLAARGLDLRRVGSQPTSRQ